VKVADALYTMRSHPQTPAKILSASVASAREQLAALAQKHRPHGNNRIFRGHYLKVEE